MLYADGFLDVFDNQFSIMTITFDQFKDLTGKSLENESREKAEKISTFI